MAIEVLQVKFLKIYICDVVYGCVFNLVNEKHLENDCLMNNVQMKEALKLKMMLL